MPADIFVDPAAATTDVIRVGGVCYRKVEDCDTPPNVLSGDIEATFSGCDACNAAPCDCEATLPGPFTFSIAAGGATLTRFGVSRVYTWAAKSLTLLLNGSIPNCDIDSESDFPIEFFTYIEDGSSVNTQIYVSLEWSTSPCHFFEQDIGLLYFAKLTGTEFPGTYFLYDPDGTYTYSGVTNGFFTIT